MLAAGLDGGNTIISSNPSSPSSTFISQGRTSKYPAALMRQGMGLFADIAVFVPDFPADLPLVDLIENAHMIKDIQYKHRDSKAL